MANLKIDLEKKLLEIGPAIVKLLNSNEVQEYIDVLTTLAIVYSDLTSESTALLLLPATREKLEVLKAEKANLENNPKIKMYWGLWKRHAELVDAYRLVIAQEEPTIQSR